MPDPVAAAAWYVEHLASRSCAHPMRRRTRTSWRRPAAARCSRSSATRRRRRSTTTPSTRCRAISRSRSATSRPSRRAWSPPAPSPAARLLALPAGDAYAIVRDLWGVPLQLITRVTPLTAPAEGGSRTADAGGRERRGVRDVLIIGGGRVHAPSGASSAGLRPACGGSSGSDCARVAIRVRVEAPSPLCERLLFGRPHAPVRGSVHAPIPGLRGPRRLPPRPPLAACGGSSGSTCRPPTPTGRSRAGAAASRSRRRSSAAPRRTRTRARARARAPRGRAAR